MPPTVSSADGTDPQGLSLSPGSNVLGGAVVDTWVKTLQAAEALHVCLRPTYVRHSHDELLQLVERALHDHRGPSQMVAEMLAQGQRNRVQTA